MSELLDDAIGIYHQMFDFSDVRIPFSSFPLALIKHYRVHFSQLGPMGLNKVITFKVLCRSLQIESTVTLFRVFQTLCKQGDWYSFSKRRTPSPVYIDDNRSCMKHWKSGFFFIDRQVIPDDMVWRHPNAAIDDPVPAGGSFNMADVLSRIWKSRVYDPVLRGADGNGMGVGFDYFMLCPWPLLLAYIIGFLFCSYGAEFQEEPHLDVRPTLQRLLFYCTPPVMAEAVMHDPTLEDLAVGTPSFKIVAKAEASQKSDLAQSSGSTTRPSLFVGDDDDDACVEIPLVTPLRSAAVIPSSGNQGGSSVAPTAEGSNTRDSRGKGVMVDDTAAPSSRVSQPRPSSGLAPSFKDVSGDAIHTDFFPFSTVPYYATYPEVGAAENCEFTREEWDAPYRPTFGVLTKEVFKDPAVYKTMVDQFPTPGEMVRVESLSDDQLITKMSLLHCMMMSHGDELLACYRGLNQSHHEYVLSADSRLKGYEEKVANMAGLELQVAAFKKQVARLNDKLTSSDAYFAKSKAKGKERKKNIKSLGKSLDNLHDEVARLSAALNQATILEAERDEEILRLNTTPLDRVQGELLSLAASVGFERGLSMHRRKDEFVAVLKKMISEHATEPLSVILQLEPEKLVRPANVPLPRGTRVSPPIAKESTVTPVYESLELYANVNFTASTVASEHNKEIVNVEGISVSLVDVAELVEVGSGRVPSGLDDVVVALSAHEKGDGLDSSSAAGEETGVNPSEFRLNVLLSIQRILSHATHPRPNGFPIGTCSIAGQASVGSMS
ncbi:hypothetical protein Tco_1283957 [Tanacetum coccineum]